MSVDRAHPEAINRLDRFWETFLGNAGGPGVIEPDLASTVHRLYALDDASAPDAAFVHRLELHLVETGRAADDGRSEVSAPAMHLASLAVDRPAWRRRQPLEMAAALLLLLAVGFAAYGTWLLAGPTASPSPPAPESPVVALYVSDAAGRGLQPLDPFTLQDLPAADDPLAALGSPPAMPEPHGWPSTFLASAGGATVVRIDYRIDVSSPPSDFTVTVMDGRSGTVRTRFSHQGLYDGIYILPLLSADGSRLLIPNEYFYNNIPGTDPGLFVYDTKDGRLVSTVGPILGGRSAALDRFIVSPDGSRLYALTLVCLAPGIVAAGTPVADQPAGGCANSPVLASYDLATGELAGVLQLTALVQGRPSEVFHMPAAALSPDGRRMAFVQANGSTLTFVDTERMAIDRTVLLGIGGRRPAPTPASDPIEQALNPPLVTGAAVFSPDGEQIFVLWDRSYVNDLSLRLQTVDLAAGAITADVVIDQMARPLTTTGQLDSMLLPSPDSESLYILSPALPPGPNPNVPPDLRPWLLRRLDADTLAVEAEREFRGYRSVLIWSPTT